jgi:hypothetical protein
MESNWCAVHAMARHEKRLAAQVEENRVCTFIPTLGEIQRWSDRRSKVEVPMFSCHVGHAGGKTQVVSVELTRRSISLRDEGYEAELA